MLMLRSLVGYLPSVAIPRLVSLVQVIVLTRILPPSAFGSFVLVIAIGEAIDLVFNGWVRTVLARFGGGRPEELAEHVARSYMRIPIMLGAAIPIAYLVAILLAEPEPVQFFASVSAYVFGMGLLRHCQTIMAVRSQRRQFFILEVARSLLSFAAAVLAAWLVPDSFFAASLAWSLAIIIVAIPGTAAALRGLHLRIVGLGGDIAEYKYGVPLIGSSILASALVTNDRLILEVLLGTAALGFYASAIVLARQPLDFIFAVVNIRAFPELMLVFEKRGPVPAGEQLMDLLLLMVLASAPATLGLALIAGPLAATFLPAQYIEPVRIVIPIAAAAGFSGGLKYFVFDQACHMAQRTGVNLGVTLPAILVGTILMLVLIPAYGVAGCALGLLGQFVVALLASYIVARRMLPFTLPWRDLARIGLMTTAMGIAVQLILLGARGSPPSIQLLLAVVVGIAVYVVAAVALKPKPVRDILRFTFGNRKLKEL